MFCPECGRRNCDNSELCSSCGTALPEATEEQTTAPSEEKGSVGDHSGQRDPHQRRDLSTKKLTEQDEPAEDCAQVEVYHFCALAIDAGLLTSEQCEHALDALRKQGVQPSIDLLTEAVLRNGMCVDLGGLEEAKQRVLATDGESDGSTRQKGTHQRKAKKRCPYCAEEIQDTVVKCPFCAEWVEKSDDPPKTGSQSSKEAQKKAEQSRLGIVLCVLIVAVLAIFILANVGDDSSKLSEALKNATEAIPGMGGNAKTVGIDRRVFDVYVATPQKDTDWCWAACIEMITKYYGATVRQEDVVDAIKGHRINKGANAAEISAALNNLIFDPAGKASWVVISEFFTGVPSVRLLIDELDQGHPILVGHSYRTAGHAVLITAVSYSGSRDAEELLSVTVRDPWPDEETIETCGRRVYGPEFLNSIFEHWYIRVIDLPDENMARVREEGRRQERESAEQTKREYVEQLDARLSVLLRQKLDIQSQLARESKYLWTHGGMKRNKKRDALLQQYTRIVSKGNNYLREYSRITGRKWKPG